MFKKIFGIVAAAVLLLSAATVLHSCDPKPEKPGNEIIGTWQEDDSVNPFILVINKDNTGTLEYSVATRATVTVRQHFRWTKGKDGDSNYLDILTTSGDSLLEDGRYQYTIIGDMMRFGGLRFTRLY